MPNAVIVIFLDRLQRIKWYSHHRDRPIRIKASSPSMSVNWYRSVDQALIPECQKMHSTDRYHHHFVLRLIRLTTKFNYWATIHHVIWTFPYLPSFASSSSGIGGTLQTRTGGKWPLVHLRHNDVFRVENKEMLITRHCSFLKVE